LSDNIENQAQGISKQNKLSVENIDEEEDKCDLYIDNMRVLVVDGHENFLRKIRSRFPSWSVPGDNLNVFKPTKLDIVVYSPGHCSHSILKIGRQIAASTEAVEIFVNSINPDMLEDEIQNKLKQLMCV